MPPIVAFALALIVTVAFRFVVYVHVSIFMSVVFSQSVSISSLRLSRYGEAAAVVFFISLGLALADIARPVASLAFIISALAYSAAILHGVLPTAQDQPRTGS